MTYLDTDDYDNEPDPSGTPAVVLLLFIVLAVLGLCFASTWAWSQPSNQEFLQTVDEDSYLIHAIVQKKDGEVTRDAYYLGRVARDLETCQDAILKPDEMFTLAISQLKQDEKEAGPDAQTSLTCMSVRDARAYEKERERAQQPSKAPTGE